MIDQLNKGGSSIAMFCAYCKCGPCLCPDRQTVVVKNKQTMTTKLTDLDLKAGKVLAKEFCKDWPSGEAYHTNDLTLFFEKGFEAGISHERSRVKLSDEELRMIAEVKADLFNRMIRLDYADNLVVIISRLTAQSTGKK